MYEKYNAYEVGVGGGGGEYTPQIGFGWSNAVALILINDTYHDYVPPHIIVIDDDETTNNIAMIVSLSVVLPIFGIGIIVAAYYYYCIYLPRKYNDDDGNHILIAKLV